jgi:sugar transferase (PEP-CTERM/EpsH1 system associated)
VDSLFLCHRIPYPPDKGDKIRSYHLLATLSRRGAVDLVAHVDDPRDLRHRQLLADLCHHVGILPLNPWVGRTRALLALAGGGPLSTAHLTRPAGRRLVAGLLRERRYDVVVGFSSQVGAYLEGLVHPPLVMDLVDVDSEKWAALGAARPGARGAIHRIEARRLRRAEAALGDRAFRVVLSTERELALYRSRVGRGTALAIPNGVVQPPRVTPQAERREPLLVFVGAMDYLPNVEAAERAALEILPRVRAAVPAARLAVVGRNPLPRVRALAREPGVEVTGEVADLRPWLERAQVAVVPLRVARGVQNKVLEALAHGIPVVGSTGVQASLHPDARVAVIGTDDDATAAAAIVAWLRDPERREAAAAAGREFVAAHHDWAGFDRAFAAVLEEAAAVAVPVGEAGP